MRWSPRFFATTRGRIVRRLRQRPHSAGELADALDVSGSAIRSHLGRLERDGLVQRVDERPGIRRPEVLFGLRAEADQLFPKAYAAIASTLVNLMSERLGRDASEAMIREAGRRLAHSFPIPRELPLPARLDEAAQVIESIGGVVHVEQRGGGFLLQGYSCPLAELVPDHPDVCVLAEALLEELVGVPVREVCKKGDEPRCAFAVSPRIEGAKE